jgi:uncharacterized protein (DUF1015 family)
MARIKPFRALRPPRELAEKVAALPYDVMDTEEARAMAAGNPSSFLHISRPEIDLPPDIDPHSETVYEQGRENLRKFVDQGFLCRDRADSYYVYRQKMGSLTQTGLVVCAGVDDYRDGVIKKHELTRADKEEDRVRHIDCLDANDEPVFLTCRSQSAIGALIEELTAGPAEYDFKTGDGVTHTLWLVEDAGKIDALTGMFAGLPALYVADGHHRSAAACQVRELRMRGNPAHTGYEEYNFFLAVIFPDIEMNIMSYNRVVKDLNNHSVAEFMARVATRFEITPTSAIPEFHERHRFGMYFGKKWYELRPREGTFDENDAVARLDVSILQDNLLNPVLGIRNPRTDQRIQFVGGIRGMAELERLVDGGEYEVAFALYPTSIQELMDLADAGKIMPPKSTWFEPKLRSGLFIHLLS